MPKNLDATIYDRETNMDKTPNQMAEEHVINSIVNHDKKRYNWTKIICWYITDSSNDSWEPLYRLPGNKVVAYHKW